MPNPEIDVYQLVENAPIFQVEELIVPQIPPNTDARVRAALRVYAQYFQSVLEFSDLPQGLDLSLPVPPEGRPDEEVNHYYAVEQTERNLRRTLEIPLDDLGNGLGKMGFRGVITMVEDAIKINHRLRRTCNQTPDST